MNANHHSLKNRILIESLVKMYAKNLTLLSYLKTVARREGVGGTGQNA